MLLRIGIHYPTLNPGHGLELAEDEIRLLMRHTALMSTSDSLYHRHRFPTEIISHCVWLYFRFA